ncbi:hypothetical protein PSACC_00673 [Paramicrosporidium saccamoebae]|uniref:Uncharacterized protein n=1 Tax=Paramicrosporidium saccamoebae TaxID=1246581 RepID=A0A2H9TPB7_9FUNG|nr:hypothetical protein PSACC_00673 [Paramicrosporidium saccamoebae]
MAPASDMSGTAAAESKVIEKPVNVPVAGQTGNPATTDQPAMTNYLNEYVSQAIPATNEEHQQPAKDCPKDCPKDRKPFTLRSFLHENVSQAIPREAPPRRTASKVEGPAGSVAPAKPAEPEKPLTQKIKEAFTGGEKQTAPPKVEENIEAANVEKEVVMEEPDVQGPGKFTPSLLTL